MASYFIRRFLLIIPTFIGITLIVFVITRFVPGGPIDRIITQARQMATTDMAAGVDMDNFQDESPLSEEQLQDLKEFYGFDKPVLTSYIQWLG
jgi:microcin C transport system permease protein